MKSTNNPSGLEPLEYNVIVKRREVEQKTAGGLIMPDSAHEKQKWKEARGTVVAVSPVAFNFEGDATPGAGVGDEIIFSEYAGKSLKGVDGVEYLMVKDKDILARIAEGV